jgi:fumarate reductase subunit C
MSIFCESNHLVAVISLKHISFSLNCGASMHFFQFLERPVVINLVDITENRSLYHSSGLAVVMKRH